MIKWLKQIKCSITLLCQFFCMKMFTILSKNTQLCFSIRGDKNARYISVNQISKWKNWSNLFSLLPPFFRYLNRLHFTNKFPHCDGNLPLWQGSVSHYFLSNYSIHFFCLADISLYLTWKFFEINLFVKILIA